VPLRGVRSFVVLIAIKFNGIRQTLELFLQFFDFSVF
jgi:hypothetical protein